MHELKITHSNAISLPKGSMLKVGPYTMVTNTPLVKWLLHATIHLLMEVVGNGLPLPYTIHTIAIL